jgi:hypothetical protein
MTKLLVAALVASIGLARAAGEGATASAGAQEARPAGTGAAAKKRSSPHPAKGAAEKGAAAKDAAAKDAAPARGGAAEAAKPEAAKPCEPVKPCPIDG